MARHVTRPWAIPLVVALVAASCGSSTDRASDAKSAQPRIKVSTLAHRIEATGSARVVTTSTNSGPSWAEPETASTGLVDFGHHRSAWTQRSTSRTGKVREVRYRQIGSHLYANGPSGITGVKRVRGKSWTRENIPFDLGAQISNGARILRAAASNPYSHVTRVGAELVRGTPATHYLVSTTSHVAPKLLALGYPPAGRTQIWVDHQERTRRIVLESSFPNAGNHNRTVIEIFDFGVRVSVSAPPAHDVAVSRIRFGPYIPKGEWSPVAHGTAGRITWRVSILPIKHGECLAIDTVPAQPHETERVGGRPIDVCTTGADLLDDPVELHLQLLANGSQLVYGAVNTKATTLTLHYDDGGATQEVTPHAGAVAFSVTGNRVVTKIVPHIPGDDWSCKFDATFGAFYNCAGSSGGPITPPSDGPIPLPSGGPPFPLLPPPTDPINP